MCSLTAYYTNKQKNVKLAQAKFEHLLFSSQIRGIDATGIGTVTRNGQGYQLVIAKKNVQAIKFMRTKEYKKVMELEPLMMIGHNRLKTQGESHYNSNNHPIFTKTGLAIAHNGSINNDKELVKEHKLKTDGFCDSEVLLRLIEKYYLKKGNLIKAIQKGTKLIDGTVAFLLLNKHEPRTLYVVSVDNPIVFAYHKPTGIIYLASTEEILENSLFSYRRWYSYFEETIEADEYVICTLKEETGIKITPFGIKEFKVITSPIIYNSSPINRFPNDDPPDSLEDGQEELMKGINEQLAKEEFDPTKPVIKPSKVLSLDLLTRLKHIAESLSYPEYLEDDDALRLKIERTRILNTLVDRRYYNKADVKFWERNKKKKVKVKVKNLTVTVGD